MKVTALQTGQAYISCGHYDFSGMIAGMMYNANAQLPLKLLAQKLLNYSTTGIGKNQ